MYKQQHVLGGINMSKGSKPLSGKTIVIAGSRKLDEMSALIEKQGGAAIVRSLQGVTTFKEQEMEQELRLFIANRPEWVIFTTGIGAKALFDAADRLGIKDQFVETVQQSKIAIRGYKTYNFLKTQSLAPDIRDSDGTMKGLEDQLESTTFTKEQIWIQLHGEPAPDLVQFLEAKGASSVHTLLPYLNIAPEADTLKQLRQEIQQGEIDAICFTTAVQVRYLFKDAREHGYEEELRSALNQGMLAVSVGKVTSEALTQAGITRIVAPENERMGAMIVEMAKYFEQ